jgi:hypothetical protein
LRRLLKQPIQLSGDGAQVGLCLRTGSRLHRELAGALEQVIERA